MIECFADEILLAVAACLDARSLCALQATCVRFDRIARDPHVWRLLFARDFAVLFRAPLLWSPHAPLVDDDWPPEARTLYGHVQRCVSVPPPSPAGAGLPPPLARAFAVGKDWSWVYRACALAFAHKSGRCVWIGAVHASHGYGAAIKLCKKRWRVMQWTEHAPGWSVRHAAQSFKCQVGDFCYTRVVRGAPLWHVSGAECGASLPGLEGARSLSVQASDRERGRRTITALWEPPRPATVQVCYANGDVQVALGLRNAVGAEFVCSPHCPDARFAGRTFTGPWTVLCDPNILFHVGVLVPAPLHPDASAFWYYVLSGLVGWTDAERSLALKYTRLPCPPREIALAVAGALSAPGGPLHPAFSV
ncbi:F-box domain containing protein [Pandoravirus neocaledonia]|uniref:F-box domain containing protein n=1 Tax=Pandoravirus neocaledonia TaxID=2107708 RepID=A0A2U7UD08_9VIRU|nr:F-box domain containing protein [Pandoravirus neocaledonia]AVK76245.1 F-box domain containing protein [Pandoravirus neocaledonia]